MNELEDIMLLLNGFLSNKNKSQELAERLENYSLRRLSSSDDTIENQFYYEVVYQSLRLGLSLTPHTCESLLSDSTKGSQSVMSSRLICIELTYKLLTECLKSNNVESFSTICQCSSNHLGLSLSDFLERVLSYLLDSYDFETSHLWLKIPNDILGFIVLSVGLNNAYVLCSLYEDSVATGKSTAMKYVEMAQTEVLEDIAIQLIEIGEYKVAYELAQASRSIGKFSITERFQGYVDVLPDNDIHSIILKKTISNLKENNNEI